MARFGRCGFTGEMHPKLRAGCWNCEPAQWICPHYFCQPTYVFGVIQPVLFPKQGGSVLGSACLY